MDRIISRRPGTIVRFAMPILLVMLAIVVGSGFLIGYPQIIDVRVSRLTTDVSGPVLYVDARIKKRYVSNFYHKDSIDILVRRGARLKDVFARVRFDTVASPADNDDLIVRLFIPRGSTYLSSARSGAAEGMPDIFILLGRKSLRSIIF